MIGFEYVTFELPDSIRNVDAHRIYRSAVVQRDLGQHLGNFFSANSMWLIYEAIRRKPVKCMQ